MSSVGIWDGTQWVSDNKVWDGTQWVPFQVWDGTQWIPPLKSDPVLKFHLDLSDPANVVADGTTGVVTSVTESVQGWVYENTDALPEITYETVETINGLPFMKAYWANKRLNGPVGGLVSDLIGSDPDGVGYSSMGLMVLWSAIDSQGRGVQWDVQSTNVKVTMADASSNTLWSGPDSVVTSTGQLNRPYLVSFMRDRSLTEKPIKGYANGILRGESNSSERIFDPATEVTTLNTLGSSSWGGGHKGGVGEILYYEGADAAFLRSEQERLAAKWGIDLDAPMFGLNNGAGYTCEDLADSAQRFTISAGIEIIPVGGGFLQGALVSGGGGGGGRRGGGGGGGGAIVGPLTAVIPREPGMNSCSAVIGAGGASGTIGTESLIKNAGGNGVDLLVPGGGGGKSLGAGSDADGGCGGGGNGANEVIAGGLGDPGFDGGTTVPDGAGCGGGGMSAPGGVGVLNGDGGAGGNGIAWDTLVYAGGGGGGTLVGTTPAPGGSGGGGVGAIPGTPPTDGGINTGGGGGGGDDIASAGAVGGSGILVIEHYPYGPPA